MSPLKLAASFAVCLTLSQAQAGLFSADGMDKDCLKEHSRAWCVWDAAKMSKDTPDTSQKDFSTAVAKRGSVEMDLGMALLSTQDWMITRDGLGIGKGGSVGMWLLGSLLHGKRATTGRNSVVAWMPIEMADSEEDAGRKLHILLNEAIEKSMSGYILTPAVFPIVDRDYRSLGGRFTTGWNVSGLECETVSCTLHNYSHGAEAYAPAASTGEAPAWMGGYKAWVINFYHASSIPEFLVGGKEYMTQKIAPEISKNLPKWAYVTISDQSDLMGLPMNRGLGLPMVINEGKLYAPIFPEIDLQLPKKSTEVVTHD